MIKRSKKTHNKRIVFFVIGIVVIAFFVMLQLKSTKDSQKTPLQQVSISKQFESQSLKFKIDIPVEFKVEEKTSSVYLSVENKEVAISRIGTQFKNLEEHLQNQDLLNNREVIWENTQQIGKYQAKERVIKIVGIEGDVKTINIMTNDFFVYSLSTTSPELYDDLDQIAKSFEYLGD